jgi:hypothetical protein
LIEIAQASGNNATYVFQYGLPIVGCQLNDMQHLKAYSTALLTLATASNSLVKHPVFVFGLPAVRDFLKSANEVEVFGRALMAIGQASGANAFRVFSQDLPAVKDLIRSYGIEWFVSISQGVRLFCD